MTDPMTGRREFLTDDPPTSQGSTRLTDGALAEPPLYQDDEVVGGGPQAGGGKGEQAKQSAQQIAGTAKQEASAVASTTKEEAKNVASTAASQARNLAGELQDQVQTVSRDQRDRLAAMLHEFSGELREMAESSERSGMASELARQVASRGEDFATLLDQHEPSDLLGQARQFARRKPGTFILGAVIAGVVAGRLTRGVAASHGVGPAAGDGSQGGDASGAAARGTAAGDTDLRVGVPGSASDPFAPVEPFAPLDPSDTLDARDPYAPAAAPRGGIAP